MTPRWGGGSDGGPYSESIYWRTRANALTLAALAADRREAMTAASSLQDDP
jgi:hypothetical protein